MFHIIYNNKSNKELGISVVKRNNIPCPSLKLLETNNVFEDSIKSRNFNTFEPVVFNLEINFITKEEDFTKKTREIKRWLLGSGDKKLKFSDDLEYYYKVLKIEIGEIERVSKRKGLLSIQFTCDPYSFVVNGLNKVILNNSNTIFNSYMESNPIYIIKGIGTTTLNVNGNAFEITLLANKDLYINTELNILHDTDKNVFNYNTKGEFKTLKLREGNNTITLTGGTIEYFEIIPNWRTL